MFVEQTNVSKYINKLTQTSTQQKILLKNNILNKTKHNIKNLKKYYFTLKMQCKKYAKNQTLQ